ncbi:LON peptidase substrate-binding domain-containing protein [Nitrospinota bacterium]
MTINPLPMFPLQVVLLPEEFLPLHIFEERYKEMTGKCRERDLPFGIVLAERKGFRTTGCSARVIEVMEEFPDGRMNILIQGEDRFRILRVHEEYSYLTAEVEYFDDIAEEKPPAGLTEKVLSAVLENQKDARPIEDEIREDPKRLSFFAGAVLRLPPRDKQLLLESDSAKERMISLLRMFEEKKQREHLTEARMKNALRNGHP